MKQGFVCFSLYIDLKERTCKFCLVKESWDTTILLSVVGFRWMLLLRFHFLLNAGCFY